AFNASSPKTTVHSCCISTHARSIIGEQNKHHRIFILTVKIADAQVRAVDMKTNRDIAYFAATMLATLLGFVALQNALGQATPTPQPEVVKTRSLAVDTEVRPAIGQFVTGDDDKQYLAYELFIVNWIHQDLRLASIDLEDSATGQRLKSYDSKALEDPNRIGVIPFAANKAPVRVVPSGRTAVISIDLKLRLGAGLPSLIRHRIHFE